jgi:hypothetical protein
MKKITVWFNIGGTVQIREFEVEPGSYSVERIQEEPSAIGTRKTLIKLDLGPTFMCDSYAILIEKI